MSAGDPPVAGARRLDGFQDMNFFGDTDAATRLTRLKEQLAGVAGQDLAQQPAAAEHADRRRTRRALTEDEVARLLKAARLRPIAELGRRGVRKPRAERKGRSTWNKAELTYATLEAAHARGRKLLADKPDRLAELDLLGQERELMYKTMVLTGLRKGELASLTVGQVYLDAQPPFAELLAKDEKAGRGAMIPLRADLVEDLRDYLARRLEWTQEKASRTRGAAPITLPASSRLFTVPRDFIKIFDRDLVTAGIAKRDERDRVVDIHALRHTFGTYLSKAGVTPRVAMAAMRVAGRAKPARSGQVKTGHLEEWVICRNGFLRPVWAGGSNGESPQDGRRTGNPRTLATQLVVPANRPGTRHPPGHGQAVRGAGFGQPKPAKPAPRLGRPKPAKPARRVRTANVGAAQPM